MKPRGLPRKSKSKAVEESARSSGQRKTKKQATRERAEARSAPEFDASQSVSRDYEERLFEHYGREDYSTGHEMVTAD